MSLQLSIHICHGEVLLGVRVQGITCGSAVSVRKTWTSGSFSLQVKSASELSLPQECRESDSETQHISGSVATSSSPESSCPQAKKCKP